MKEAGRSRSKKKPASSSSFRGEMKFLASLECAARAFSFVSFGDPWLVDEGGGQGRRRGGGGKVVVIVAYTCVMVVSAKKKGTNDRVEKLILHATV